MRRVHARDDACTHETLPRTEETIAGVAETGKDVALRIELAIQCGAVDLHVRVRGTEATYAVGRSDEAQETNPLPAGALQ